MEGKEDLVKDLNELYIKIKEVMFIDYYGFMPEYLKEIFRGLSSNLNIEFAGSKTPLEFDLTSNKTSIKVSKKINNINELNETIVQDFLKNFIDITFKKKLDNGEEKVYGEYLNTVLIEFYSHKIGKKVNFDVRTKTELKEHLRFADDIEDLINEHMLNFFIFNIKADKILSMVGSDILEKYERLESLIIAKDERQEVLEMKETLNEKRTEGSISLVFIKEELHIFYTSDDGKTKLARKTNEPKKVIDEYKKMLIENPDKELTAKEFFKELNSISTEIKLYDEEELDLTHMDEKEIFALLQAKKQVDTVHENLLVNPNDPSLAVIENKGPEIKSNVLSVDTSDKDNVEITKYSEMPSDKEETLSIQTAEDNHIISEFEFQRLMHKNTNELTDDEIKEIEEFRLAYPDNPLVRKYDMNFTEEQKEETVLTRRLQNSGYKMAGFANPKLLGLLVVGITVAIGVAIALVIYSVALPK